MKKGQATLIGGVGKLIGGVAFIFLLITFFSSGAVLGVAGSKGILMLGIFLFVLWMLIKAK